MCIRDRYKNNSKKITKIAKGSKGDITLFPKWSLITYKITYNLNGGKNSPQNVNKYNVNYGMLRFYEPTRPGYYFDGWFTNAKFTKSSYIEEFHSQRPRNFNLYAKWTKLITPKLNIKDVYKRQIQRGSYDGIGKPEPLKDNLSGWWSRRIDETNRIVYCEKEDAIIIASCKGHYNG